MQNTAAAPSGNDRDADKRNFALRIESFYARSPNAAYTNTALGAIAVAVMWAHAPRALLLGWFVGILAINIASLALYVLSLKPNALRRDPARWAHIRSWWMLASGLVWGGGGALMFPVGQPLLQAFWLVLVNGIAAGVVAANAFHRPAQLAYLLPMLGLLILRLVLEGDFEHVAIAAGMGLYLAFCIVQGAYQTRLIRESVAMRVENLRLVAALRSQTRAADEVRAAAEAATRDKARFFLRQRVTICANRCMPWDCSMPPCATQHSTWISTH